MNLRGEQHSNKASKLKSPNRNESQLQDPSLKTGSDKRQISQPGRTLEPVKRRAGSSLTTLNKRSLMLNGPGSTDTSRRIELYQGRRNFALDLISLEMWADNPPENSRFRSSLTYMMSLKQNRESDCGKRNCRLHIDCKQLGRKAPSLLGLFHTDR